MAAASSPPSSGCLQLGRVDLQQAINELIDAALFAFVEGTDPEALLLLEARTTEGGHAWHYALARLNSAGLRAYDRSNEVVSPWGHGHVLILQPVGATKSAVQQRSCLAAARLRKFKRVLIRTAYAVGS